MQKTKQIEEIIQAAKDVGYIDFGMLDTDDENPFSNRALTAFIKSLPEEERPNLFDIEGFPTSTAYSRMMAAVMLKGYYSDQLIHFAYRPLTSASKLILNALAFSAKEMEKFNDAEEDGLDVRDLVAETAAELIATLEDGGNVNLLKFIYADSEYSDDGEKAEFAWTRAITQNIDSLDDLIGLFSSKIAGTLTKNIKKPSSRSVVSALKSAIGNKLPKSEVFKLVRTSPYYILPHIYSSKMSCYMRSFWAQNAHRFFDENRCQEFLADLSKYRTKLKKCK